MEVEKRTEKESSEEAAKQFVPARSERKTGRSRPRMGKRRRTSRLKRTSLSAKINAKRKRVQLSGGWCLRRHNMKVYPRESQWLSGGSSQTPGNPSLVRAVTFWQERARVSFFHRVYALSHLAAFCILLLFLQLRASLSFFSRLHSSLSLRTTEPPRLKLCNNKSRFAGYFRGDSSLKKKYGRSPPAWKIKWKSILASFENTK